MPREKKSKDLRKEILIEESKYTALNTTADILIEIKEIFLTMCSDEKQKNNLNEWIKKIIDDVLYNNEQEKKPNLILLKLKNEWLTNELEKFKEIIKQGKMPDFDSFIENYQEKFIDLEDAQLSWSINNENEVKEDITLNNIDRGEKYSNCAENPGSSSQSIDSPKKELANDLDGWVVDETVLNNNEELTSESQYDKSLIKEENKTNEINNYYDSTPSPSWQ